MFLYVDFCLFEDGVASLTMCGVDVFRFKLYMFIQLRGVVIGHDKIVEDRSCHIYHIFPFYKLVSCKVYLI